MLLVVALLIVANRPSQSETGLKYTQEEMTIFWDEHLGPLIGQLTSSSHPNETVNSILQDKYRLMYERYGHLEVEFRRVRNYSGFGFTPMGANYENGKPVMEIILPTVMDEFYAMQAHRSSAQKGIFENAIIIGYLHEFEHFIHEDPSRVISTLDERVESESLAWAKTAQSMELLKSAGHFELHPSDQSYYNAWVQSGRNETNSKWRGFIRDTYRHTVR